MKGDREGRVRTAAKWAGLQLARVQGCDPPRFRVRCLVNGDRLTNPADPDGGDRFTLAQAEQIIESISRAEMLDF